MGGASGVLSIGLSHDFVIIYLCIYYHTSLACTTHNVQT